MPAFRQTASIIYLGLVSLQASINLPTGIERAILKLRLIWFFNSQGLPAITVANSSRELLPHVFTLSMQAWWYSFLWHFLLLYFYNTFPLGSEMLCVARTFLSSPESEQR